MTAKASVLLILASVVNAVICVASFWFGVFATSPDLQDATMRIGYYVMWGITLAAAAGVIAPWILVPGGHRKTGVLTACLPAALVVLAVLAFLLLDSWLQRQFGG